MAADLGAEWEVSSQGPYHWSYLHVHVLAVSWQRTGCAMGGVCMGRQLQHTDQQTEIRSWRVCSRCACMALFPSSSCFPNAHTTFISPDIFCNCITTPILGTPDQSHWRLRSRLAWFPALELFTCSFSVQFTLAMPDSANSLCSSFIRACKLTYFYYFYKNC